MAERRIESTMDQVDDEELVARARRAPPGDGRAFVELVQRHEAHVRANCQYLVGNDEATDDLAQEVFVKAYFGLHSFEGRSAFGTWVRRIKVNHCLNHVSAAGRRPTVDIDGAELHGHMALRTEPRGPDAMEREELQARVDQVLRSLPDTLRVALVLRDMDGLSQQEVAAALEVSLSAAKMRIMRGREAFREAWIALAEEGR